MIIVLCWQNLKNLTWKKLHSLFTKLWVKRFYMNLIFVLNKYMAYFEPTSKFLGVSIHCLPGSEFYSSPKLRRTKSKTFLWLDRDMTINQKCYCSSGSLCCSILCANLYEVRRTCCDLNYISIKDLCVTTIQYPIDLFTWRIKEINLN